MKYLLKDRRATAVQIASFVAVLAAMVALLALILL